MFKVDDYIFYGSGGICRVDAVCEEPFDGAPKGVCYYVLHTVSEPKQVIWNPVANDKVLMRPVLTREEAMTLLDRLADLSPLEGEGAKALREQYITAIKSGLPDAWGRVLITVCLRERAAAAKLTRVTEAEHGFFDNARRLLGAEIALAEGCPLSEAEQMISARLPK